MATEKIRIGVIGANVSKGWAHRSHLPALLASPEFELAGVCTTRPESAEESARQFGARMAFHNHEDMLASAEIDAVAVVVRVPSHYRLPRTPSSPVNTSSPSGPWGPTSPREWSWPT